MTVKDAMEKLEKMERTYENMQKIYQCLHDGTAKEHANAIEETAGTNDTMEHIIMQAKTYLGIEIDNLMTKMNNTEINME